MLADWAQIFIGTKLSCTNNKFLYFSTTELNLAPEPQFLLMVVNFMWKLRLSPSNQWSLRTFSYKLFLVISQTVRMCPLLLLFHISPGAIYILRVCVGEGGYTIFSLEERHWSRIMLFKARSSTNNISATQELVRNVSIWVPSHTDLLNQKLWLRGPGLCVLTRAPGDSDVHSLWEALVQSYQHPPTLISDERCDHCQSGFVAPSSLHAWLKCPPLFMDQLCAHSALCLAWPECRVCTPQSLQHSCMLFSSHFYFIACVPCSRRSFSEELRSGRGIYLESGGCISFLESPQKQWGFNHLYSLEIDLRRQQDGSPDSRAPEP